MSHKSTWGLEEGSGNFTDEDGYQIYMINIGHNDLLALYVSNLAFSTVVVRIPLFPIWSVCVSFYD